MINAKIVGYDMLQYVAVHVLLISYLALVASGFPTLKSVEEVSARMQANSMVPDIDDTLEASMDNDIWQVQNYIIKLIVYTVMLLLFLAGLSAAIRSRVYAILSKKQRFGRFVLYNTLWISVWAVIIGLAIAFANVIGLLLIIPYLYLSAFWRFSLQKHSKFSQSMHDMRRAFTARPLLRLGLLVLMYAGFIVVALAVFPALSNFLASQSPTADTVFSAIGFLITIAGIFILANWSRTYILEVKA